MTIEEAKKTETAAEYVAENANTVMYQEQLLGRFAVKLVYQFKNGKLWHGAYLIDENHSNPQEYISDYKEIKSSLIQKYGKPSSDEAERSGDGLWGDVGEEGRAVIYGYLKYVAKWKTERTNILLILKGDKGKAAIALSYQDASMKESASTKGL